MSIHNINIYPKTSLNKVNSIDKHSSNNSHKLNFTNLPPLSVYIHFPWCEKKCPYCDFNSHEIKLNNANIDEENYIKALENDLIATLPLIWGRTIHSVFIGGGTPSLISIAGMEKIMQMLRNLLPMHSCLEITMEANPSSSEIHKFKAFANSGINRISLGIQSFNNEHLKSLGRIHTQNQAMKAIEAAHQAFNNINLDLMFALPNQTIEQCYKDVTQALSFNTTHLSCYHLTLEANTYFAKYPPNLPNDDVAYEMQDMLIETLFQQGFKRYEISAYAKHKNHQSQHNLNYWNFGDYIGIGAGAHGKISSSDKIMRYVKHKHPKTYIQNAIKLEHAQQGLHIIEQKSLNISEIPFEFMLNTLRLVEGTSIQNFIETTSLGYHYIANNIEIAQKKGLLSIENNYIKPTNLGLAFLNDLQMLFL